MTNDQTTNYETPCVTDHGDLVELTAASTRGGSLDNSRTLPGVLSGSNGPYTVTS